MNRRGHDIGGIRNGRDSYGGAWEKFGDGQLDIAGGMAELLRRGHSTIALLGHSFGGISTAAYAASILKWWPHWLSVRRAAAERTT